jgi:uncharacterized membrane protein YsdA (DUF1294 family)/cold shock CspA family protein
MRYVGRLADWHDDKGYGFVVPNGGGDRAFVHVKAFERQGRRPANDDLVSYAVERDARGRLNAVQLRFAGVKPPRAAATQRALFHTTFPRKPVALLAFAVLAAAAWRHALPLAVVAIYVAASLGTFVAYWWDKAAAQRDAWRTPENTLHVFALLGGWPGALLAQDLFCHKTSKAAFQATFWCTVLLNCGGLAWWLHAS